MESCPQCGAVLKSTILDGLCPVCVARCSLGFDRVMAAADSPVADRLPGRNASLDLHLRVEDYEIESEIARGGVGVVYRARQLSLNRPVALKLLLAGQFADAMQVRRFRAEAAALARLEHPAIVPVYEVGEYEGRHFFSMRLIEGQSLAKAMERFALPASFARSRQEGVASGPRVRARQRELARFMADVALAVHHAHQRGVLHRDLKPGNVLLDPDDRPHVTDFGLARLIGSDTTGTKTGLVFGTPAYMAPEQISDSHNVTTAADVYSLGAMTYELLTGRPPFEAGTPIETVIQVRDDEPIPPRDLEPAIDRDLETLVLKCLDKDPSRRYGTALALAEELMRFTDGEPLLARPVSFSARAWRWARRHPTPAALWLSVVVLVLALAVGGPSMAIRLAEERNQQQDANRQYRKQLQGALLAQARAERLRGEVAHRDAGLEAVANAARVGTNLQVLNEAVAQLVRFDISGRTTTHPRVALDFPVILSPDFEVQYLVLTNLSIVALQASNQVVLWSQTNLPARSAGVLRISPDGAHLVLERDGQMVLLQTADGQRLWSHPISEATRFGPDGSWILLKESGRGIRRLDTHSGTPLTFLPEFHQLISEYALCPDPKLPVLARILGNHVELWNWETGQVVSTLDHANATMRLIAWQDQHIAIEDDTGSIFVWHLPSRLPVSLKAGIREIKEMRFVPKSSLLLVTTVDGRTTCWDTDSGDCLLSASSFVVEQISADGSQVMFGSATEWGTTGVVRPEGRRRFCFLEDENPVVRHLAFNRDSSLLAAVKQLGVCIQDLRSPRPPLFVPHFGAIACFFVPETGDLVVQGRMAIEWYAVTATPEGPKVHLRHARRWEGDVWLGTGTVPRNQSVLVVPRSGAGLEVLDLKDGGSKGVLEPKDLGASYGIDGFQQWAVLRRRSGLAPALLDLTVGHVLEPFDAEDFIPQFSPDGRWLLGSSKRDHRIYSVRDWSLVRSDPIAAVSPRFMGAAAWSPDSREAAEYEDQEGIVLRDVHSGSVVVRLTTPYPAPVTALNFSPGGRWLAAGTSQGAIEIWDFTELAAALRPLNLALNVSVSVQESELPALPRWTASVPVNLPASGSPTYAARDPKAGPAQLDLSKHYNAHFEESWLKADVHTVRDNLSSLPTGLQRFNDVLFDVRGIVQLSGHRFWTQPIHYPVRVKDILVGQPVKRLHLLGAALDVPRKKDVGAEIARVRFRYRDGGFADWPLLLGRHLDNHWMSALEPQRPTEALLAWRGLNGGVEESVPPACLELSHVILENPHPHREVATLDLISADGPVPAYIVALTVE